MAKGICRLPDAHSGHARARGNFHGYARGRRPFDAAEDEGSGGETLCGFAGRRLLVVIQDVTRHVEGAAWVCEQCLWCASASE